MAWPLRRIAQSDPALEERILEELTAEAERLPPSDDSDDVGHRLHDERRLAGDSSDGYDVVYRHSLLIPTKKRYFFAAGWEF